MLKLKNLLLSTILVLTGFGARANDGAIISPDEALALAAKGELIIVDVRTPAEWRQSGVPSGAATVELNDDFVSGVLKVVNGDRTRPVGVICRSGRRSAAAQSLLLKQGFVRVLNINEGVLGDASGRGWQARGLPMRPFTP